MKTNQKLLFANLLFCFIACNLARADPAELTSLHGTMVVMMSKDSGMPFEIWAKGNNVRTELSAGGAKIVSIQRGNVIYTFGEGATSGNKEVFQRGLGTLGIITQIAEVKSRGKKQSTHRIDGETYDLYKYDVNAPFESATAYLSRETSLPRLWISVLQTADKSTQTMRMIFQNMEANVSIPDQMFEVPTNVNFGETTESASSPDREGEKDASPRDLSTNESGLVVVIAPPTKKDTDKRTILNRQRSGDVLKILKEQEKWLYVEKVKGNPRAQGWVDRSDVLPIDQAHHYFSEALKKNSQDVNALFGRANLALFLAEFQQTTQGNSEEEQSALADLALADFGQAALIQPNVDTYIGRGLARQLRHEWRAATADFDAAIKLEPNNIEALRHRALAWIELDEFGKAVNDCNRLVDLASEDADAHSLRCLALSLHGEFDEAMLACNTALNIDPALASAYARRGTVWAAKNDDLRAKSDYDAAIRLGDNTARISRARILIQQGKREEAIRDLNVLIQVQPKNYELYVQRGLARYFSGDFTNATKDFDVAINEVGNEAKLYLYRGSAHNQTKNVDAAIADFSRVIELEPMSAEAYTYRGVAWVKKNEPEKALSDFNTAVRLAPDFDIALINRAGHWQKSHHYGKALDDFRAALRINPKRSQVLNEVAWILAAAPSAELRDGAQAVQFATRACELTEWKNSAYLSTLAASHAETGEFESAVRWQRKSLQLASDEEREEAKKRLDRLKEGQPIRLE